MPAFRLLRAVAAVLALPHAASAAPPSLPESATAPSSRDANHSGAVDGDASPPVWVWLADKEGSNASVDVYPHDRPAKLQRLQAFIGKSLYSGCQTFPGRIGEVIVYNRALTLEETLGVQKYLGDEFGCCLN